MGAAVGDPHFDRLILCLEEETVGSIVFYVSLSLFFYDYALTLGDELTHIWRSGNFAIGSVLFVLARYLGATSCILSALKPTLSVSNAITCVRVAAIIASEAILAIRAWAVWGRSKWIMGVLVFFALVAIISAGVTVGRDVNSTTLSSMPESDCLVAVSTVGNGWVIPLMMTIMYEIVTITLTIARIIWWRKRLPSSRRAPLLDTLWKDGVIYFALMLGELHVWKKWDIVLKAGQGIGAVNTGLVIGSTASVIRQNVTQLQTSLHSMLSTRIVLHLANSGVGVKNIHSTMTTTSHSPDDVQFTTIVRSDYELTTVDATRNL